MTDGTGVTSYEMSSDTVGSASATAPMQLLGGSHYRVADNEGLLAACIVVHPGAQYGTHGP